jgi:hypothetical protein
VFEDFDFVYSTGFTITCRSRGDCADNEAVCDVKPGGQLLLANFLPDVPDVAYMETFMGWPLIYRSDEEMAAVASGIEAMKSPRGERSAIRTRTLVFLEVEKTDKAFVRYRAAVATGFTLCCVFEETGRYRSLVPYLFGEAMRLAGATLITIACDSS